MSIHIQMLGTGNAFAKKYFNTNALLRAGDFTLMVDCGITAPLSLHTLGQKLEDINGVLITHLHGDHTGGLEELGFRMIYQHQRKLRLYVPESLIHPLWEHNLKASMSDETRQQLEDYFEVVPLYENQPYLITNGISVQLIPTRHIPGKKSYSLLFNDHFFYSADLVFDPDLLLKLYEQGVDTFYHDCQLHPPAAVHTGLHELLTLPIELQKCIRLMHYEDDKDDFVGKTGAMQFIEQHQTYIIARQQQPR